MFKALEASVSLMIPILIYGNAIAAFNFCGKPHDVPIGETNTAVACSMADRTGFVCAVNADSFFVEGNPHDANRVSRTRWKHVKIPAPLTVLEHLLVVAKPG